MLAKVFSLLTIGKFIVPNIKSSLGKRGHSGPVNGIYGKKFALTLHEA